MDSFEGETQDSIFRMKRKPESDSEVCQELIVTTQYELQHHPCGLRNTTFVCLELGSGPEMSVINQMSVISGPSSSSADSPGGPAKKGLVSEVRPVSSLGQPVCTDHQTLVPPSRFPPSVPENTHGNLPPGGLSVGLREAVFCHGAQTECFCLLSPGQHTQMFSWFGPFEI